MRNERRINFIGSTRVGAIIAAASAKYLKPYMFGALGSTPLIVLNDAGEKNDKAGASAKQRRQARGVALRSAHRSFPYSRGRATGVERRSR
ncbi:aldehyde dehydrogenase family protein [Bradyrhizobium diazoefficiens]